MNYLGKTTTITALAIAGFLIFTGCTPAATVTPPAANSEASTAPAEQDEPAAAAGTRQNPNPIGSVIEADEWTVTVNSVTLGANDAIAAENPYSDAPADGMEYILVNATITYTGDDDQGAMPAFVSFEYVTADGVTTDSLSSLAIAPDALDSLSPLYNGGTATGNVVLVAPAGTAGDGVIAVRPGMISDKVFVAVQ